MLYDPTTVVNTVYSGCLTANAWASMRGQWSKKVIWSHLIGFARLCKQHVRFASPNGCYLLSFGDRIKMLMVTVVVCAAVGQQLKIKSFSIHLLIQTIYLLVHLLLKFKQSLFGIYGLCSSTRSVEKREKNAHTQASSQYMRRLELIWFCSDILFGLACEAEANLAPYLDDSYKRSGYFSAELHLELVLGLWSNRFLTCNAKANWISSTKSKTQPFTAVPVGSPL